MHGGVAQLGERRVRNAEVGSSILLLSTTYQKANHFWLAFFLGLSNEKPESLPSSPGAGGGLGWFMAGNSIGQAPFACPPEFQRRQAKAAQ